SLGSKLLLAQGHRAKDLLRRVVSRRRGRCELGLVSAMVSLLQRDKTLYNDLCPHVKLKLEATLAHVSWHQGQDRGRAGEERPFLVAESSENRGWWIQLSNVRIELTPQHTDELCEVVDRLAECYPTAAEDLERYVLRSIRFPYAQRGYRLY